MKLGKLLSMPKPVITGLIGLAIVGSGAAAAININAPAEETMPEMAIVQDAPAEVVAESDDVVEPEETVEVVKEEAPASVVETPKQSSTTKTTDTQATTQPAPSKETIVYSILGHKKLHKKEGWTNLFDDDGVQYTPEGAFTNINDFEKAAVGLCPNQIPAGAWPQIAKPGVALGIIGSPEKTNSPMAWTDWIWNTMKQDPLAYNVGHSFVRTTNMGLEIIGDDGVDKISLDFTIDWPNRLISWKRTYESSEYKGKEGVGTNATNYMNSLTAQMTVRLRQRDAEFKAKCGY